MPFIDHTNFGVIGLLFNPLANSLFIVWRKRCAIGSTRIINYKIFGEPTTVQKLLRNDYFEGHAVFFFGLQL